MSFLSSIEPGLNDFHEPIIDALIKARGKDIPALASFPLRYPTAGSEEGIREVLTLLAARGVKRIYTLRGDYEGYREMARTRRIATQEVELSTPPSSLERGWWFLSNPSARDGNLLPEGVIAAIANAGHKIFYDLSYMGSTSPGACFDLTHPNVAFAAISFSKPYGLFYYRVGFTFAREEIPALYANRWFKNVLSTRHRRTALSRARSRRARRPLEGRSGPSG
jgi:histidinol-phosphate/aromatic aminotransferase/cobyric acid decarboxylase-like protein